MALIDIGNAAVDRPEEVGFGYTLINKNNPANETGRITSVEIYAVSGYNLANCEVATFHEVSTDSFSTRDTQTIGNVTAGSKQTFIVDLDVEAGDYIGIYYTAGRLEEVYTGYAADIKYQIGDKIPCTNQAFGLWVSGGTISLYGTGTTIEVGENAIFFGMNF